MAIKQYKPDTAGRRGMSVVDYSGLSKVKPEKSLLAPLNKKSGRNNYGRITVRHRGGGNRRKYRIIDFKRDKHGMPAKVLTLEYDPNRSAHIALVQYEDGEKRYIIAPAGLKVGDTVISGTGADIKPGNALPLSSIPAGTFIHNVKCTRQGRAACAQRRLHGAAYEQGGQYAAIRHPPAMRYVPLIMATIGQVGNVEHENVKIGKAGRRRHMGWRPAVRGSAMNPSDHPHGGGEGKSPIGMPSPVTPWGKPTLGYKTRARHNRSDKFIVKRRGSK